MTAWPDGVPTHRLLHRTRLVLLSLTAATLVLALATLTDVYGSAATVRDRSSQAVLEVTSARLGAVRAYESAVLSAISGKAQLTGPGPSYLNELGIANQSLARIAELNVAGEPASRTVQITSGLLSAFGGAIGEADAQLRAGRLPLALAHLSYASRLLHDPSGGLLPQLHALGALESAVVADQVDGGTSRPLLLAGWFVASSALLGALLWTIVWMARRFRRTVNVPLALATVIVAACVVAIGPTATSIGVLNRSLDQLRGYTGLAGAQAQSTDYLGERELVTGLTAYCGTECGETVDEIAADPPPAAASTSNDTVLVASARAVTALTSEAATDDGRSVWVPASVLGGGMLVLVGLRARLDDYRFNRS